MAGPPQGSWRREGLPQGLLGAWPELEGAVGSRELPASRRPALQRFVNPNSGPGGSGPHCALQAVLLVTSGLFWGLGGAWGASASLHSALTVTCFSPHYPHHEECLEVGHTERTRPGPDPRHPQATPSQSTLPLGWDILGGLSSRLGLGDSWPLV